MKQIWQKGESLNEQIHTFTVGDDYLIDREILPWDIIGTAAHVKMLEKIKILNAKEKADILVKLEELYKKAVKKEVVITPQQEDCHTAIEQYLTESLGDAGAKVHTGRSRNDQILLAMRLFVRAEVVKLSCELAELTKVLLDTAKIYLKVGMPGYTHFQPAMPSSIGMWLHAFAEGSLSLLRDSESILNLIDYSPLGAGAGFGVSLPLDREFVAKELKFNSPQRSPIDVQNSRGRSELKILRWCSDVASMIEKLSWDMIIYSSEEYKFISIPKEFTTGSSIMPQKRNPDVLELLRGKTSMIRSAEFELNSVISKLPSNYHRDFQLTKSPVIRGTKTAEVLILIMKEVVTGLTVNEEELQKRMVPELYATYDAYREVKAGVPFRDAYRISAKKVDSSTLDVQLLKNDLKEILDGIEIELRNAEEELEIIKEKFKTFAKKYLLVDEILN